MKCSLAHWLDCHCKEEFLQAKKPDFDFLTRVGRQGQDWKNIIPEDQQTLSQMIVSPNRHISAFRSVFQRVAPKYCHSHDGGDDPYLYFVFRSNDRHAAFLSW